MEEEQAWEKIKRRWTKRGQLYAGKLLVRVYLTEPCHPITAGYPVFLLNLISTKFLHASWGEREGRGGERGVVYVYVFISKLQS